MEKFERKFHIYDLEITKRKKTAPLPGLSHLIPLLQNTLNNKDAYFPVKNDQAIILLSDFSYDKPQEIVTLLFRLSDPTTPDHIVSNPMKGTFRKDKKLQGEGDDYSCHVLISVKPEKGHSHIYTCAVEKVTKGVTVSYIKAFFSQLLKKAYKEQNFFSYPTPTGALNTHGQSCRDSCQLFISLQGRPSDDMIDIINNGTIKDISLIQTKEYMKIDSSTYTNKLERSLSLKRDKQLLKSFGYNKIEKWRRIVSKDYEQLNISVTPPDTSSRITIKINTEDGSVIGNQYTRYFLVSMPSDQNLDQSSQKIISSLHHTAVKAFVNERNI